MAVSNNFGEFLARTYHGWFIERMKDLRTFINQAFVNVEGGLKRNTIPLFCTGDASGSNWSAVVIDAISAQYIYLAAYQLNYGLGSWEIKAGAVIYALEGGEAKTYNLVVNIAAGAAFVLAFNSTTDTLTISVPNDDSGTLAGLRAALLADPALRENFAVSGEDATTLVMADIMVSKAITAPAQWGSGLSALLAMASVYFERLEANWGTIYIPADATAGTLDTFLPGTIHLEVWNDGQLMQFQHLAIAASAE